MTNAGPTNLLFILSDEHNPKALGCAGHPFQRTPNLDALAARGTRFTAASTPSPICVPARAALATGLHPHRAGRYFDNADPYDGAIPSWHHALRDGGHTVVSVGKLHFRGLPGDDHGFSREIVPMHVVDGLGDLLSLIRDDTAPVRGGAAKMSKTAGPGESDYTRYDRAIAAAAARWLAEEAPRQTRPWCLFVSLVTPHFPLIAPPEHYALYPAEVTGIPKAYAPEDRPTHPFLRDYAATIPYDHHVGGDRDTLARMLAGYHGLVSFMDERVGEVLAALDRSGEGPRTRVLYASDHGDNAGARGLWGKSNMFEESVGIPMILAGPGIPAATARATPCGLTDVFATALDATGAPGAPPPGSDSLVALANTPDAEREAFSEYHASGSRQGAFMLRTRRWKYVRYPTYPAQLFDLQADPEEMTDLGADPAHAGTRAAMEAALLSRLGDDPAALDARVKARQAAILAANGGRAAVEARGDLPYSPPPGVNAAWS